MSVGIGIGNSAAPAGPSPLAQQQTSTSPADTFGVRMLSLQDAIAQTNSSTKTRNDFSLWDEIRRIHLPKLNTDYIKGYGEKNVENLRTAILISRYVQRKFHDLLEESKSTHR